MRTSLVRWRLVSGAVMAMALFAAGTSSADAALPDQRAYELVSPPEKGGADIVAMSSKTRASTTGNAVTFTSLQGFGDARGGSLDFEYVAKRDGVSGTSGWTTHAISPQQPSMTLQADANGQQSTYEGLFSSDLSRGVYRSWLPLTDAANVASVSNLYRRSNLLGGTATTELLSDAVAPIPENVFTALLFRPWLAGVSADLNNIIFESANSLTSDAPAGFSSKLYENAGGAVRLVGRIPTGGDGECDDVSGPACTPASASQAGVGASAGHYTSDMVSRDGTRVFFQSSDTGGVYVRENGTKTVQLNVPDARVASVPSNATLWAVSAHAQRVFFVGDGDLYMYDFAEPVGQRLTLVSVDNEPADGHGVQGVVGVSAEGRYVYFIANGQLVSGAGVPVDAGLYLWHDGSIAFIGALTDSTEAGRNGPLGVYGAQNSVDTARVTPDGRHLFFMARREEGLVGRGGYRGYDHGSGCSLDGNVGPCREQFVYSADSGELVCASCRPDGIPATDDVMIAARSGASGAAPTAYRNHALSDDGRHAFFNTRDPLVLGDVNGKVDAYEYDVPSRTVHLISTGTDQGDSFYLEASPSGDDVFFVTRQRLVRWDVDDNYDLYDARVNGGFPDPIAPPAACTGEQCQGQVSTPPAQSAVPSASFRGTGDTGGRLKPAARARARRARCAAARRGPKGSRRRAKCPRRASRRVRSVRRHIR